MCYFVGGKITINYIHIMNSNLKALSLAIIVIAAVILILSYFLGWTNNNSVQFGSLALMIVGLIAYIIFGKRAISKGE